MTKRAWGLLILSLVAAGVISLFASSHPDGLERVLEDHEVAVAEEVNFAAPMPDYVLPAIEQPTISASLAGITGMLLTLGIAWGAFQLLSHKGSGHHAGQWKS